MADRSVRHAGSGRFHGLTAADSPVDRERLNSIVKAYDVRGIVGEALTERSVEALAAAFVDEVGAAGDRVVVGHDMRDSSPAFAEAFARGATSRGAEVVAIGLCSTDELSLIHI